MIPNLVFTSLAFSFVAKCALNCRLFLYGYLWLLLSITSIIVHSPFYNENNSLHKSILLIDKSLCYMIIITGAYTLFNYVPFNFNTYSIPILTFLLTVYLWYKEHCVDIKYKKMLHMMLHIISMIGHYAIIINTR